MLSKAHKLDPKKDQYSEQEKEGIIIVLEEQSKAFPKASAPLRLILKYSEGEQFGKKFNEYIKSASSRALPSLFNNVKQLYLDPKKVVIIEEIIVKHLDSLRKTNCFFDNLTEELDPTVFLWILLYAAQHYDIKKDYKQALLIIDEAIEHTPTLVEVYTVKAKILKHQGEFEKASESYNKGRELDQADRYLNARYSKYLIRAGKLEEAEKMMALFTREVNGELNVHEMQCMWYELELGAAYEKQGQIIKALKMYKYIEQHFSTVYDDQVNIHI